MKKTLRFLKQKESPKKNSLKNSKCSPADSPISK